jgi:NADH:ubiquinone oxidoreductase subunit E
VKKLFVCTNHRANPNSSSCAARGSKDLLAQVKLAVEAEDLQVSVEEIQCMGYCEHGPNIRLAPNGEFFHHVKKTDINQIVTTTKLFIKPD